MKRAKGSLRPNKVSASDTSTRYHDKRGSESYKLPDKPVAEAQMYDDMERNFEKVNSLGSRTEEGLLQNELDQTGLGMSATKQEYGILDSYRSRLQRFFRSILLHSSSLV